MKEITVPPKDRIEWEQMVTGELEHTFTNYVLQMKVHHAQREIKLKINTIDGAIESLYELCNKYVYAVHSDLQEIFKSW